jgi:hypothetical protein
MDFKEKMRKRRAAVEAAEAAVSQPTGGAATGAGGGNSGVPATVLSSSTNLSRKRRAEAEPTASTRTTEPSSDRKRHGDGGKRAQLEQILAGARNNLSQMTPGTDGHRTAVEEVGSLENDQRLLIDGGSGGGGGGGGGSSPLLIRRQSAEDREIRELMGGQTAAEARKEQEQKELALLMDEPIASERAKKAAIPAILEFCDHLTSSRCKDARLVAQSGCPLQGASV